MIHRWRRVTRNHGQRRRRAAAVVEFAVVLPLLLMMLFGIVEYGYLFMVRLTLQHAAREGARQASLSTSTPADVAATVAGSMAGFSYTMVPTTVGCQETVTVTIPRDDVALTGFFTVAESYFGGTPRGTNDLEGTSTMRKEGCTGP